MRKFAELEFLEQALGSRVYQYRKAPWLISEFEDDSWTFVFTDTANLTIDFKISLQNESLIAIRSGRLVKTIKYWLLAYLHPDGTETNKQRTTDCVAYNKIISFCHVIDYFLINESRFALTELGFSALDENSFKQFLHQVSSHNKVAHSIYQYPKSLRSYLLQEVKEFRKSACLTELENPHFDFRSTASEDVDDILDLPRDLVPFIKLWMQRNDLYWRGTRDDVFEWKPNITRFSKILFKNTLRGKSINNVNFPILGMGEREPTFREYRIRSVTRPTSRLNITKYALIIGAIKAVRLLHSHEFAGERLLIPSLSVIKSIENFKPVLELSKRFRTVPPDIIFSAIRNAVEFHLEFGDGLCKTYENLLRKISKTGTQDQVRGVMNDSLVIAALDKSIKNIGIKAWSLQTYNRWKFSTVSEYFIQLRANRGLCELLQVYIGSVAIVVGALSARRRDELQLMAHEKCLDSLKTSILFHKAKSTRTLNGMRSFVGRPIDELAVEMILNLQRIQAALLKYGFMDKVSYLFMCPSRESPLYLAWYSPSGYYRVIDTFCDYFETPVEDGERYYIRQHQLRRFFAMTFFWGGGFGKLDTLRWFLGHSDLEHLYNYITENCDGQVLRDVKANYAAEHLSDSDDLATLIQEKYKTDDFSVLESEEVEDFIAELIDEGEVVVEPEFFRIDDQVSYKILIKVIRTQP